MRAVFPINNETWLVCGGRDFSDVGMFDSAMFDIMRHFGCPSRIVHGCARGADAMADALAKRLAIAISRHPADWEKNGRAAGPIRNAEMLQQNPDKVIAFPGGKGTADMIARARKAGIDVVEVKAP